MLHVNRILHPTDFSAPAEQALDHALFLADASGGHLDILHVIENPSIAIPDDYVERAQTETKNRLARLRTRGEREGVSLTTHVRSAGDRETAASCILAYAEQTDPALLVVGTHGRHGLGRWLLGSTTEKILRRARQNVYVVREEDDPHPPSFRRILAPLDFSPHARRAVDVATRWSRHFDAHLSLLHVLASHPPPGIYGMDEASDPTWARRVEDEVREELREWDETIRHEAPDVESHLESGDPAAVIVDYAAEHDVDLLILASHGRTGVDRFLLGSTTERVVRNAPCPVLVVKPYPEDVALD